MAATAAPTDSAKPKKSHKKLWIVLGIIAVVIVALVIGYFSVHSNPKFCNAICHSPMDKYVNDYYGGDSKLLITAHADNEVICLDCHEPTLSQQVSEGIHWITGNFTDPLTPRKFATREFCLRDGCHTNDDIVKATDNYGDEEGVNPHNSHQGQIDCYNCHSVHGTSEMYCNSCHSWEIPEGWENPGQS
ncbi:MAG: cytochrome c3 family protein [Coriobacteriia bacterium]